MTIYLFLLKKLSNFNFDFWNFEFNVFSKVKILSRNYEKTIYNVQKQKIKSNVLSNKTLVLKVVFAFLYIFVIIFISLKNI